MTFEETLRARHSVRKYKSDPVPKEHIHTILEAAMLAPSACNTRPWEFVVITNQQARAFIAAHHPYAKHAAQSPVVIIACALPGAQRCVAEGFYPQDCGAAVENLLLQAAALGYGTCWCGVYPREQLMAMLREEFQITSTPFALITLGVPDEQPPMRGFYEEAKVRFVE